MFEVEKQFTPPLDPAFLPAVLWNRRYAQEVKQHPASRDVLIHLGRPDGSGWQYATRMLPADACFERINSRYGERLIKFLLWARGGNRVLIHGAPDLVGYLQEVYVSGGERAFDAQFMGPTCFLHPFGLESVKVVPDLKTNPKTAMNRDLSGFRIGFDLGGSDRKCAALIEGEVVFSEEIKWDPYFQSDPNYHLEGIRDSLKRAAEKLPRVDAIGGSAAGIYINSEPRVASLFRGISAEDFQSKIRFLFRALQREWGDVPFVVANDGDVTALSGAMSLNDNAVLGVSMGTSEAAGYVDSSGCITGWLNELAFAPVDYRLNAPRDEWSGDAGCGVQYFSQQAVGRLISASRLAIRADIPLPEKLEAVQLKMQEGDQRAATIYQTIGTYFGYTLAHYAEFYDFRHLLYLGRVSSGEGGRIIQETAESVLAGEFPELAERIAVSMPDETMKRHGQAVAAAALPVL